MCVCVCRGAHVGGVCVCVCVGVLMLEVCVCVMLRDNGPPGVLPFS